MKRLCFERNQLVGGDPLANDARDAGVFAGCRRLHEDLFQSQSVVDSALGGLDDVFQLLAHVRRKIAVVDKLHRLSGRA